MATTERMNRPVVRAFIWSGPVLILAMLVAQLGLMGFVPPPSPNLAPQELARIFIENKNWIRLGTLVQCMFWGFWCTWGVAVTLLIRKMERGTPILTYGSLTLIGGADVFFILVPLTWGVIAFRPETLDPSVMQIMNDWVWFIYLFSWPPFSLWMVLVAIAIFTDHNKPSLYPRWVAYFNIWCAVLLFPAGLIVFFKTGLFAYDGLGAFWIPFLVFFGYIAVMTMATVNAVKEYDKRRTGSADQTQPGSSYESTPA